MKVMVLLALYQICTKCGYTFLLSNSLFLNSKIAGTVKIGKQIFYISKSVISNIKCVFLLDNLFYF